MKPNDIKYLKCSMIFHSTNYQNLLSYMYGKNEIVPLNSRFVVNS